jgi:ABC-type dipeptide/oligopeptide/nickel transport system permease subunit
MLKQNLLRHTALPLLIACAAGLFSLAALAPRIIPYHPLAIDLAHAKESPSGQHWFGTDTIGRDVLSRVMYGGRISLLIGCSATIFSLGLGLCVGLVAGYCGGWIDDVLNVVVDLLLAFPSLLLAIGISVLLPAGITATVLALCAAGWPSFARLFRGMVLSLKEHTYVDAARSIGCTHLRIIFVHILPHCLPLAFVAASIKVGGFILSESALSFLGLGVQPPVPTWGSMVSLHRAYLASAPWMVFFPGAAIAATVFIFNYLGDALRDRLDPAIRARLGK